jgi:LAO/AO transport system kinase
LSSLTTLANNPSSSSTTLEEEHYIDAIAHGIIEGDRLSMSRGITLSESSKPQHQLLAASLSRTLTRLRNNDNNNPLLPPRTTSPPPGEAFRIGISGPPGAGKSSLIEALGCEMVKEGHKVAVLAIDPSSKSSGGAILGDKTRMPTLSNLPAAFVRPSPTRGTLGGVARATSDAVIIAEAAGYQRILVETVGVGQSETQVDQLVDCVLLVAPPAGGDEIQVIKRGITEIADIIVVNKADGDMIRAAKLAAASFRGTVHFLKPKRKSWTATVTTCSALTHDGIPQLMEILESYRQAMGVSGELGEVRKRQRREVMWTATEEAVLESLRGNRAVEVLARELVGEVESGAIAPRTAAEFLCARYAEYD